MNNTNKIIQTITNKPGFKAKEIAKAIGLNRKQVNSALYGVLKDQVFMTDDYRWYPKKQSVSPSLEIIEENSANQIDGPTDSELETVCTDELRFQDPFKLENDKENTFLDSE